jgi:hypothetical protein
MSTRFFVEILARAKDNEAHVGRWVDDMKKVYSMHIPACVWFLTYVLQNNVLYPLILECPSERLRIAFADLLIHIFKTLSPYEYTMWHDYQLIQVETGTSSKFQRITHHLNCGCSLNRHFFRLWNEVRETAPVAGITYNGCTLGND